MICFETWFWFFYPHVSSLARNRHCSAVPTSNLAFMIKSLSDFVIAGSFRNVLLFVIAQVCCLMYSIAYHLYSHCCDPTVSVPACQHLCRWQYHPGISLASLCSDHCMRWFLQSQSWSTCKYSEKAWFFAIFLSQRYHRMSYILSVCRKLLCSVSSHSVSMW
jgi:hypothetical protein